MKDIYLTSTFTNPWNVKFNALIGTALESQGVSCYLPHRDTNQQGAASEKFRQDMAGMDDARLILAVAQNESPNWGAELGYAYGLKKPILALTDKQHLIPLICQGMITEEVRVDDLDSIGTYAASLAEKVKKYIALA